MQCKILILVLALCPLTHAQVMRCVDAKGSVTFSDGGCKATQKSSTVVVQPATGKDQSGYEGYSPYNRYDRYDRYAREERYAAASRAYQKQRKFEADRQNARAYDEEIKRVNDERMRKMNSITTYPGSTSSLASQGICRVMANRVRCY